MDIHPTLKGLLDYLFSTNALSSYNIFNGKNNFVNGRLRFTKCSNSDDVKSVAFRRKSEKQTMSDHERAARHQRERVTGPITRSQTLKQDSNISHTNITVVT